MDLNIPAQDIFPQKSAPINRRSGQAYDVIIIGAGPAGLACANMLKNTRFSVLVVDKNLDSYSKPCGGALTKNVDIYYCPQDKTREFTQAYLYMNDRIYTKTIEPVRTVSRKDLFTHMLGKIKNVKNITVKKEHIQRVTQKAVFAKTRRKYRYKYLVGADGSSSVVRRFLKLPSRYMMGMYFEIPKVTDAVVKIYDSYNSHCEYMWVFPHIDYTNMGMGFNPDKISMKQAKQVFLNFLYKQKLAVADLQLHTAPLNYDYKGCVFDNIYLIGDAAGLVMKLSGEGIPQAIISGEEIGWKIAHPEYTLDRLHGVIKRLRSSQVWYEFYHKFRFLVAAFIRVRARKCPLSARSLFFGTHCI